jgi:hypothetical protein
VKEGVAQNTTVVPLCRYASGGAAGGLRSISEERGSGGGGGGPRDAAVTSAELRKSVAALKESENICATDRDTHCVKAMISFIKTAEPEKLWYPACPGQTVRARGVCLVFHWFIGVVCVCVSVCVCVCVCVCGMCGWEQG